MNSLSASKLLQASLQFKIMIFSQTKSWRLNKIIPLSMYQHGFLSFLNFSSAYPFILFQRKWPRHIIFFWYLIYYSIFKQYIVKPSTTCSQGKFISYCRLFDDLIIITTGRLQIVHKVEINFSSPYLSINTIQKILR